MIKIDMIYKIVGYHELVEDFYHYLNDNEYLFDMDQMTTDEIILEFKDFVRINEDYYTFT
jgi:hypothetical protein